VVKWTPATARISPLARAEKPSPAKPAASRQATGAHGLEWKEGKLWIAVPPAQMIYCVNPDGFRVEHHFPTAGDRPHGLGWQGEWLWCVDSNKNAFFKHDTSSGRIVDSIQLSDNDPLPHGMTIRQETMWYCDDVGVVCRFPLPA
jgi:hypothetical protein